MTRKTLLGGVALAALATSIAAAPVAAAAPSVTATVTDGTLHIQGGPHSDRIALRVSPVDRTQLQVDVGDDGSADARSTSTRSAPSMSRPATATTPSGSTRSMALHDDRGDPDRRPERR